MPATRPVASQSSVVEVEKAVQGPPFQQGVTPFTLRYDKLVIAVGAYSQSKYLLKLGLNHTNHAIAFDVPGVKEHAHFLKDVKDARMIRSRVLECEAFFFIT